MMQCIHAPDFREGIRAMLIDKDFRPQWKHASLHEVADIEVMSMFQPAESTTLYSLISMIYDIR